MSLIPAVRAMSRMLPRGLKDGIPPGLKAAYYARMREHRRQGAASVDALGKVVESLRTQSLADYLVTQFDPREDIEAQPTHFTIEINSSCNLNCVMCRSKESQRPNTLMDLSLFEDSLLKLKSVGARAINFHTINEVTANVRFGKYLEIMRKHRMTLSRLSSNCQLLDRAMDTIIEYSDVIEVFRPSIDGASKATYEFIREGGTWETLNRNLMKFAERNNKLRQPIDVEVSNVVMKCNFHEIGYLPAAYEFAVPVHKHNFGFIGSMPTARGLEDFRDQNYFDRAEVHIAPCNMPWQYMVVLTDGRISGCCVEFDGDVVYGDVASFDGVFNSPAAQAIRSAHRRKDMEAMPPACRYCYAVDPRFSQVIDTIVRLFYTEVRRHPAYLQAALDRVGPALKAGDLDTVMAVAEHL